MTPGHRSGSVPRVVHASRVRVLVSPLAALLALAACGLIAPAQAAGPVSPLVRPWTPPATDSLVVWAAEARTRFQTQRGDSATEPNQHAFDLVGEIGRRLLRSLGRANLAQAPAIKPALDSLRLDTDVVIDPALPEFVLVMVRNPFRPTANRVGFLYWYRDEKLRRQGVVFSGGESPRMRVWWTSRPEAPYEWGILNRERDPEGRWGLLLLRLNPDGLYWNLAQYEEGDPDLGRAGEAYWEDLNGDDQPEIVSWVRAGADSSFEECLGCPHLISERIFTEHEGGFGLHDSRLLSSPYASFVLFVRLLREKNRAAAARLLQDPAKLDEAVALGWGGRPRRGEWKLEYAEPRQAWPRWLALRFKAGKGEPLYVVHFTMKDGRWIIRDWAQASPGGKTSAKAGAQAK